MTEHCLPPLPAPVAAPIVEHAVVEPPPVVEELPPVDPVLAPPPAPVLAADPAPAVETVEEAIFLAMLLVLSQVYVIYHVLPAVCSFSAYVCLIDIFFLGFFVLVNLFIFWSYCFHALYCFGAFVSSSFCIPLWPSVAVFKLLQFRLSQFVFG